MDYRPKRGRQWRVIPLKDYDIYKMHSLEDAICDMVGRGKSPPTIVFSTIDPPAVSISKAQNLYADVNVDLCHSTGVDIARRNTGGRSMFLDKNYLVVSMIGTPSDLRAQLSDTTRAYRYFCNRIKGTLRKVLGMQVTIENSNDIMIDNRKLGGVAQRQHNKAVVVHGFLRYEKAWTLPLQFLMIDGYELTPYISQINAFTTSVRELKNLGYHEFYEGFKESFLHNTNYFIGDLIEEEIAQMQAYRKEHINSDWVYGTPDGSYMTRGNCDIIAGRTLKIPELEELLRQGKLKFS